MNHFPSFILLSLALLVLTHSQAAQPSIAYIEGCYSYAQDGCCLSCEYAFTLSNGKCVRSPNTTADCCSSYSTDGSCAQCAPGLYSSDPYCNRNQIYGCVQKSGNTCVACGAGLALQNGICFTIIANCQSYSNAGECVSCKSGFALANSYCVAFPQVPNCAQSNIYGCIQCSDGYYLTRNRLCNAFQAGCLQYYQQNCTACLPSFDLISGACRIEGCATLGSTGCSQCQNGYTLDHGRCYINNCAKVLNGVCVACHGDYRLSATGCVAASSYSCKACQSGFIFVNNRCIQIINGCTTYTTSYICSACLSNFQLTVNGLCQIIGCSAYCSTGCTSCTPPFQLANATCLVPNCESFGVNGCTSCSSNFLLFNGQCFPMDPNCQTYTNSACSQCKPKFHLLNGGCVKNDRGCIYNSAGQCSCANNFVLSSCGQCIILGCSSYDTNDNCLGCLSPFVFNSSAANCYISNCQVYTEAACKTCASGFTLVNGICQVTDAYCASFNSNGACTACQNGFFYIASAGKCFKNVPNCASFSDQITCQSCQTGYLLFNGQCLLPIPNCQTQSTTSYTCACCASGYHLAQGSCVQNDAYCASYTLQNNTELCASCASGYQLISGKCIKTQPGCIYNGTVCSSCQYPFTFDPASNTCFIAGCTNYTLTGCQVCKAPFSLLNGSCLISNCASFNRDCCLTCSDGFSLVNGSCINIDANCAKFVGSQCIRCNQGYSILKGRCVIQDSNCEAYNSEGRCSKCVSSCYLDAQKKCQIKELGCVYEGSRCKFCNPPFVLNMLSNSCIIKNCLQAEASGCILCQSPFVVSDKQCALPNCNSIKDNRCVQCSSGYHLKNGVTCEANSDDCLSYDGDGNCEACKSGLTLNSNAVCSALNSTCLEKCQTNSFKCLSCASGYFLNKFFQCEKQDGKCIEYTNGVCSQCSEKYFLFSEICFPYTPGCTQYNGKDCVACRKGYALKGGECFRWNYQSIGVIGQDDIYNFQITPIDVRQSKYYINNLSPGSAIGKFFFSSFFDSSYQDCSLSTLSGATGKGWKAAANDIQFIGLKVTDDPTTFFAIQLEAVDGNYISEFYLEYSVDGTNYVKVQDPFTVPSSIVANMTTIYFPGIYAKAIRIRISKFQGWPACRIEFFYFDSLRFNKIENLKSLKYLQETINYRFVDRVNNQIYINQAYFFNPIASCASADMCFTGLQLCQPRQITSMTLSFSGNGTVSEFYLTYSVDGRSYNCLNGCSKVAVDSVVNGGFTYKFNNLRAQGIRIYPTKYTGNPNFSPAFFYS